jgi:hypothetical protein
MFDCASLLDALEKELRATLDTTVTSFVATAWTRLESEVAEVAKGLAEVAEVAEERAQALAMVDARKIELAREVETMHKHKEAQEGRVDLNIGGHRFKTSVQALRRVPHTFLDAYLWPVRAGCVRRRQHLRGPGRRALWSRVAVYAKRCGVGGGSWRLSERVFEA